MKRLIFDYYRAGLITMAEYHRLFQADLDPNNPLDRAILGIYGQMERPNGTPETSNQMRNRADNRRAIATSAKLSGARVNPAYE